jgi:exodeoxyribonuclease V alpha subunit
MRRLVELPPLSPRGSARQRLDPAPAYPPALVAELADAELGDEALYLAWQLAAWAPGDRGPLVTVIARALAELAQGSTRVKVDAAAQAILRAAAPVVGAPGARTPLVLDGNYLYTEKLLASEDRLVTALRRRTGASAFAPTDLDRAVAAVVESGLPRPTDEQAAVVRAALGRRFAVITGGPGTGKTTIVLALVRALVRLGVPAEDIALAAPTGKAANRLEEALREGLERSSAPEDQAVRAAPPRAETLHRRLGYAPHAGAFQFGAHSRLPHRAVIVDEGSMIDLFMMERLAAAVADDALLVLMGDADQLPSVEAGAVFRDLAPLGLPLTRSFRMDPARAAGRRIYDVARAVKAGDPMALAPLLTERTGAEAVVFEGAELVPPGARERLLERWYADRIAALADFDGAVAHEHILREDGFAPEDAARLTALSRHYQSFRLLCLTRARPTGVEATNAWLHRRHGAGTSTFAAGEPILMLRNDYDRGLYNGDQGLVVRVREGTRPARLMAVFFIAGRWAAWDLDSVRDTIELAFAMTVHKAQGSEYDDVALLLPDTPLPLLSRELLYTALSRSRRAVVLCGTPAVLAAGVERLMVRSSGVGEKLATAPGARLPAPSRT